MKNLEAVRYRQRLDHLFGMVRRLPEDAEVQAQWARYLCILASGFLEVATRSILSQYAKRTAAPNVVNYVERRLRSFQNPKMGKILELVGAFSPTWEATLREATKGELKDSVDSIVANRCQLAHGRDVGVTFANVERHYRNAVKVVEELENICV